MPSRASGRRTPIALSMACVADGLIFGSTSRTVHQSGRYTPRAASHSGYFRPSCLTSPASSADIDAVDDTAYAPRLAEFVRWVGVSAPGGPPPSLPVLRADDSSFFSHLPMNPPPPTGLENMSGSSV